MAEGGVDRRAAREVNEPAFTGALEDKNKAGRACRDGAAGGPAPGAGGPVRAARESADATARRASSPACRRRAARGWARSAQARRPRRSQDEGKRAEVAATIEGIYNRAKTAVSDDPRRPPGEGRRRVRERRAGGAQAVRGAGDGGDGRIQGAALQRHHGSGALDRGQADRHTGRGQRRSTRAHAPLYRRDGPRDRGRGRLDRRRAQRREGAHRAEARKEIAPYVASLRTTSASVGSEAGPSRSSSRSSSSSRDVDWKQEELVNGLAQRYVEARGASRRRIDEMKAANRGLVERAFAAIGGVIRTILQLKDMLLGVLKKGRRRHRDDHRRRPDRLPGEPAERDQVGLHVSSSGTSTAHLKSALMEMAVRRASAAGIRLPETFDLKGILEPRHADPRPDLRPYRLDPGRQQLVDQPVVEVEPGRVDRAAPRRQHARHTRPRTGTRRSPRSRMKPTSSR